MLGLRANLGGILAALLLLWVGSVNANVTGSTAQWTSCYAVACSLTNDYQSKLDSCSAGGTLSVAVESLGGVCGFPSAPGTVSIWTIAVGSEGCTSGSFDQVNYACSPEQIFSECVASGKTFAECDVPTKPTIAGDFPPESVANVCKEKDGKQYCVSESSWPTGCGYVNGSWMCVESIPDTGINFDTAGNPPGTVNGPTGIPEAQNPRPTAINYNHSDGSLQGQYGYESTGQAAAGNGDGQQQIDTSGLAQDSTLNTTNSKLTDLATLLDGTADTTGLDPANYQGSLDASYDGFLSGLGGDQVTESDWLSFNLDLPTTATCTPMVQTIPYYGGTWTLDPCTKFEVLRELLGWFFYIGTVFFIMRISLGVR